MNKKQKFFTSNWIVPHENKCLYENDRTVVLLFFTTECYYYFGYAF
jgi:hypothetical protein